VREVIILLALISLLIASYIFHGIAYKKQAKVRHIIKALFASNCLSIMLAALLYYNTEITQVLRSKALQQLCFITALCAIFCILTMIYQYRKRTADTTALLFAAQYAPLLLHCGCVLFFVAKIMILIVK
jgi:hypothetical protein